MYDPGQCSDADCEWVELYNNDSFDLNLSDWKLDSKNISGTISTNGYLIVARNNATFLLNFNATCNIIKASISLTNSGKNLYLNDSANNIIDTVSYIPSWGANGNNKTLSLAGDYWRESLQAGGTPCAKNFEEHNIDLSLEQTNINDITVHLTNSGLSDESITLDFFVDGILSKTDETLIASFDSGNVTFALENLTVGQHTALVNITYGSITAFSELNFSTLLPDADVYLIIEINQSIPEYTIYNYPENASIVAEVFVMPASLEEADVIVSEYDFDMEHNWLDAYSDIIDPEVDFGSYYLCAKIIDINNYNDTNLENNFICEEFTIEPPATQTRKRIKTFVTNENYGLNETLFWSAQIFPLTNGMAGNLTINLQKRNSQDIIEVLKIENLNLTETLIFSGNYTIPDDRIEGIYKIRAKFSYADKKFFDSQDSGQFWLNGLKDIGPANFTVLQLPESINFGGFKTVFVKFFSGNYNYGKLKFLVYGYPRQVLADTSGEGISASDYDSDVAIELDNVKRGQEIYIALPAFAKQNCGEDYNANLYRTRVRAYDETGKPVATSDINMQFSGKSSLCNTKESETSSGRRVGGTSLQQKQQQGALQLQIVEFPNVVQQGDNFILKAKIANNLNSTKQIELYSYVFDGQKLVTEGGWTANREIIELKGKETKEIELENTVKDDAALGTYALRVRVNDGNRNIDADAAIAVVEKTRSETASAGGGLLGATGAAVYVSKTSTLNPVLGLFVFLLLILVLILIRSK